MAHAITLLSAVHRFIAHEGPNPGSGKELHPFQIVGPYGRTAGGESHGDDQIPRRFWSSFWPPRAPYIRRKEPQQWTLHARRTSRPSTVLKNSSPERLPSRGSSSGLSHRASAARSYISSLARAPSGIPIRRGRR